MVNGIFCKSSPDIRFSSIKFALSVKKTSQYMHGIEFTERSSYFSAFSLTHGRKKMFPGNVID